MERVERVERVDQEEDDAIDYQVSMSIFEYVRLKGERGQLLDTLKDVLTTAEILLAPMPGSDLNRRFSEARELIAIVEAE